MVSKDFLIGLFVGLVAFFIFTKFFGTQKSDFTMTPFTGTDPNAIKTSYQTQTQQIANEMKAALTAAIDQKQTKDQLVAISNKYNDYSCALTKAFAEWNIRNVTATSPVSSPAPR
jgi:hypothetical protein